VLADIVVRLRAPSHCEPNEFSGRSVTKNFLDQTISLASSPRRCGDTSRANARDILMQPSRQKTHVEIGRQFPSYEVPEQYNITPRTEKHRKHQTSINHPAYLSSQPSILAATSKLFLSKNMKCPFPFTPTFPNSINSTPTPACLKNATVQ
jgi:hypothetical protein